MASDPVIEAYKKGIDRTLLRENLKLTPEQRLLKAMDLKRCGLLMALRAAKVDLIVVGGVAAAVHGSARFTSDLDIVYSRDPGNVARLARALAPRQPYPRGAAPGLPFLWDDRTIRAGLNFTLSTGLGENLGLFAPPIFW